MENNMTMIANRIQDMDDTIHEQVLELLSSNVFEMIVGFLHDNREIINKLTISYLPDDIRSCMDFCIECKITKIRMVPVESKHDFTNNLKKNMEFIKLALNGYLKDRGFKFFVIDYSVTDDRDIMGGMNLTWYLMVNIDMDYNIPEDISQNITRLTTSIKDSMKSDDDLMEQDN